MMGDIIPLECGTIHSCVQAIENELKELELSFSYVTGIGTDGVVSIIGVEQWFSNFYCCRTLLVVKYFCRTLKKTYVFKLLSLNYSPVCRKLNPPHNFGKSLCYAFLM
jgi:hypothetical protein